MESAQAGDQIQSSVDTSAFANTIVNEDGWLQVPRVLQVIGAGASAEAYTDTGANDKYKVDKKMGVVAYHNEPASFTNPAGFNRLLVSDGSYWYETDSLTQI